MTFADAARKPLRSLLVLSGRSGRQEFWSYLLVLWLAILLLAVALRTVAPDLLVGVSFPVIALEYLALWAVTVRRLHDTGRSGWTLLIAVIPLLGLIVLVIWLASRGHVGPNRYGPSLDAGRAG